MEELYRAGGKCLAAVLALERNMESGLYSYYTAEI